MPDIKDGEIVYIQGSARKPYELKNVGAIYSCSCPAWRNQSLPIERRTCKHLKKYCGEQIEYARVGGLGNVVEPKEVKEKKEVAPVLLAHRWEGQDIEGFFLSEKLDGIRALWDGKQLISRLGNPFHVPEWFLKNFPKEPLDGELWMARKSFQVTSGLVRRHDEHDGWKKITYRVFDAPAQKMPFEERMKFIYELLHDGQDYIKILEQIQCKGLIHLKEELSRIESLGGEGLMAREPGSLYEVGRSHTLLKIKNMKDSEAVVQAYEKGKGRHKGRMGALVCQDCITGEEFRVGTGFSDAQRENPSKIGSKIVYAYQELTNSNKPRFPVFLRNF